MAFSSFVPNHSVHRWFTSVLPLVAAPWVTEAEAIPVSPAVIPVLADVSEAAPVVNKVRKSARTSGKTPHRRSPKTAAGTQ